MKKHLLSLFGTAIWFLPTIAQSQTYSPSNRNPVADNSQIGTIVNPTGANNFNIDGGLRRGQNLFHSFTDFSIRAGGAANFTNPAGNQSIITRVTGNLFSDINGLLNTNGTNFLLINPHGVVFGPNTQLNVGKAFAASTATGVDLIDGQGRRYTFGTSGNGDAPLLSIDPNVFLNISRLNMSANLPGSSGIVNYGTLQTTNSGQYIGLIGGNVTMNAGKVIAPGGRIELGGLVAPGSIGWGEENNFPKLTFPTGVTRSTVTLTDESIATVAGNGGGSIAVTAQNLNVLNGSGIGAGIFQVSADRRAGDIEIDVTQNIEVGGNKPSFIKNEVSKNSVGDAGNISIKTQTLNINNRSQIQSSTKGNGNGGNISIAADEIDQQSNGNINTNVLDKTIATNRQGGNITIDTRRLSLRGDAFISADTQGLGRGGNLTIKVVNLEALDGGSILANTFGKGTGGTLSIVATSLIRLDDRSGISASAYNAGNAGDLSITTNTLQMTKGGYLSTGTIGKGNAGNLSIFANKSIDLDGSSKIFAATFVDSGQAGNLSITTDTLQLKDGSQISASIYLDGSGNAGNLTVNAHNLQLKDGSQILTNASRGSGNAGNLTVNAHTVEIDGELPKPDGGTTSSGLFAQVDKDGRGNGGTLRLNTQKLSVSNGGKVQAATFGKGNAGNLFVKADEIDVFNSPGVTPKQPTSINAGVGFDPQGNVDKQGNPVYAQGNAGNLSIDTRRLSIRNGASISSDTQGKGNGGQLAITATESVTVLGAGSTLTVGVGNGAVGNGGELKLQTPQLVVTDNGTISTSSAGTGTAGRLRIDADTIDLDRGAITGETRSGKGGNIELNASDNLLIRDNSRISATAGTAQQGGDGGNIQIITPFIIALPDNNDITANAYTGNGGKVTISSNGLIGIVYREKGRASQSTNDITASSNFGQDGNVEINTPGTDPGKDKGELPAATNDASKQISQACGASQRDNKFYITGRGGLPPNASEPLESDALWSDARAVQAKPATTASLPPKYPPPAIGWVFQPDGRVRLIAAQTTAGATKTRVGCPSK
ncbi:filamentous hemagglutinin N-terminal domain-containing protein [Chamaesiphon sp. VAR_48_metabat_135_sub]|uniref:two-partner secretion domain-containing protein n=1 Tax=Chamaesiphon sp. VAR_48_metabat_135_sub TaxID=2964699 RepID=UPI00286D4CC9|nr:filamentous hemagglutinin N-terminal domain-containing protein [Chamaesiphon sp. VAR_48_metabat_135_sub]